jgi:hypothetical protein
MKMGMANRPASQPNSVGHKAVAGSTVCSHCSDRDDGADLRQR